MRLLRAALGLLVMLPSPSPATPSARDTLTIGLQLEPPNLDPTSGAAAATDEVVSGPVMEGLTVLDRAGTPRPLLATGWRVSADGLEYRFTLRSGVRFSDGTPFDAGVVRFSLQRAIAPGSTNALRDRLSNIRTVIADGLLAVSIRLAVPDADLPRWLAFGDAVMVSPRAVSSLATAPIGTGPFRLGTWRRGDSLTLDRNPGWWGGRTPLGHVRFRFVPDPSAAAAAIRAHDIDLFMDFPAPEALAALKRDPSLRVDIGPTQAEVILALNNARAPFNDVRVRRAIAQAIDRRAIIDGAMSGYGTPIGSHFPPQDPAYVDLTGRWRHDPVAAAKILQGLGPVTLALPPPSYARRAGEIVGAQLRAAGMDVRIESIEWAQWLDRVYGAHAFDMTIIAHVEPYDYAIYARPDYYFGYAGHAGIARLMDQLRRTQAPAARAGILAAIQRRIADDAVNGFLFQLPRLGVADASLRDIWIDTPLRSADFATARFVGPAELRAEARDGAGLPWGLIALGTGAALILALGIGLGARGLLRRGLSLGLTLIGASIAIFLLLQVVPGDPAAFMMGIEASPRSIAALHAQLGLDGPAWARYLRWAEGMLLGDFGTSYTYRVPVAGLIRQRLVVSLPLALLATAVSILVGIGAGMLAMTGRWRGRLVMGAAQIGLATPAFWLGLLLIMIVSVDLGWAGAGGFPGWRAGVGPALGALILPALALALPQAAVIARVTARALGREAHEPYVRTARAKGVGETRLLLRHMLPNAATPILTVLGLQFPFLLAGSVIVESVFVLPGLGRLMLQAIEQRDLIVVQGAVMLMVAVTVLASLLIDVAAVAIDPRLRRA